MTRALGGVHMRWFMACITVLIVAAGTAGAAAPGFSLKGAARLGTAGIDGEAEVALAPDGTAYAAFTSGPEGMAAAAEPPDTFIRIVRLAKSGEVEWTVDLDGSRADYVAGVAIGSDGGVFVAGYTLSSNFPGQTNAGVEDLFLARYDTFGNQLWIRLLGGTGRDFVEGLAVGPSGAVYLAGWTDSARVGDQDNAGDIDALVARFEANGKFAWVRLVGTDREDFASGIDVAASSAIFVAGYGMNAAPIPSYDITLMKFLPSGARQFAKTLGGKKDDVASAVTAGPDGWIYLAGESESHTVAGRTNHGGLDVIVAKFHASGTRAWVRLVGGTEDDFARSIDSPLKGAIYVAGFTRSDLVRVSRGIDALLLRFDDRGHPPLLRQFGGAGDDEARSIAVTGAGILVGGRTGSARLLGRTSLGMQDAFIARFK